MDNPDTQAILGTWHITKTNKTKQNKTKHIKLKRWATRTPPKTGGEPRCSRRVAVPASHKTLVVLLNSFLIQSSVYLYTVTWQFIFWRA